MEAIETVYNGHKFRSRTEARWAVFFDAMGIKYEYELDGFELSNGEFYLPDFYLIDLDIFVEVKPSNGDFISFDDEHVFFGDDTTSKYGAFVHDATKENHSVWFVFGDPYDALRNEEHGGKGINKFFTMCTCVYKKTENHEQKCYCKGKEQKVSDCKANSILCAMSVSIVTEEFVVCNMDSILYPEKDDIIPMYLLKEDCMKDLKKYIEDDIIRMVIAMPFSRQVRFEHGKTPTKVSKIVVPHD